MTKQLRILSLASTGRGCGFVENGGIKVPYFVGFSVPGDLVTVKNERKTKRYVEAELDLIVEASPQRNGNLCSQFTVCGGCNLLHVDYELQVSEKARILEHMLDRKQISHPEIEVVKCARPFNYRYKAKLFFSYADGQLACGFKKRRSNEVVLLRDCRIVHGRIETFVKGFNAARLSARDEFSATLVVDFATEELSIRTQGRVSEETRAFLEKSCEHLNEPVEFSYEVSGSRIRYDNGTFLQSNLAQNERLVEVVLRDVPENGIVFDLYGGIGNFAIPLSKKSTRVYCVEKDKATVRMMKRNCEANGADVECVNADVGDFLQRTRAAPDTIVLDPPRGGCDVSQLRRLGAKNVVYVSCNPLTLKEDLKELKPAYEVEKVTLVDMFPQTEHIECVVLLGKRE